MKCPLIILALCALPLCAQDTKVTPSASQSSEQPLPWTKDVPADLVDQYINGTQLLDENPSEWRATLREIFYPHVKDLKTAEEAAFFIAKNIGKLTGVYYSTERSRACLNPIEALAEKKASCTGLSILFAAALRSVDIPSRIAGVVSWNHVRGNHTWTEVWIDGEWRMLEFGEGSYNTGWVMEGVGMLDNKNPYQRVLATTGKPATQENPTHFFLPWAFHNKSVGAEDVSERYQKLAKAWYEKNGIPADKQRLMIDVQPREEADITVKLVDAKGTELSSGLLPKPQQDMREMLRLLLPRDEKQSYFLLFPTGDKIEVKPTGAPVQVIRLSRQAPKS